MTTKRIPLHRDMITIGTRMTGIMGGYALRMNHAHEVPPAAMMDPGLEPPTVGVTELMTVGRTIQVIPGDHAEAKLISRDSRCDVSHLFRERGV